ncbi:hypothetical protein BDN70DRAFT_929688 [Pholiota conissans]|uniref:Heme haloperoxidase family profile domain-containing protein n=1 Tax=Pholiota conissans TaxID=109636 RepID=A0A9P5Z878_9AGAR|nr:hypothetical protein BDN70DRAFT_929688 [Pholiota conissans]
MRWSKSIRGLWIGYVQKLKNLSSWTLFIPTLQIRTPIQPPGFLKNSDAVLINDYLHPWRQTGKDDIGGPCPGLNTLASRGWLPRNDIASPAQIVNAVQEGVDIGNDLAIYATYVSHLIDGNLFTEFLSIGGKAPKTRSNLPAPAIVWAEHP